MFRSSIRLLVPLGECVDISSHRQIFISHCHVILTAAVISYLAGYVQLINDGSLGCQSHVCLIR